MVLINSMAGGLNQQKGFDNNFNMLLPFLMGNDDMDGDMSLIVPLLAMQAQSPGSVMNSASMLPLLLMNEEANNQELIMFMMMINNNKC